MNRTMKAPSSVQRPRDPAPRRRPSGGPRHRPGPRSTVGRVEGGDLDSGVFDEDATPEIPDIAGFERLLDEVFERWRTYPST
jgi:hypothetical protein